MTSTSAAWKPSSSFALIRRHATSFSWIRCRLWSASATTSSGRCTHSPRLTPSGVASRHPRFTSATTHHPRLPLSGAAVPAPTSARLRSHPSSCASSTRRHGPPHPDLSLHSPLSPLRPHSPLCFHLAILLIASVSVLWINVDAVEA
jgi:hypothetical protein